MIFTRYLAIKIYFKCKRYHFVIILKNKVGYPFELNDVTGEKSCFVSNETNDLHIHIRNKKNSIFFNY